MCKTATVIRLFLPLVLFFVFLFSAGRLSAQYVENQSASEQAASYWISGTGSITTGLSVGAVYNTTNTSPNYYSTYKSQFWGPITIEGTATSQVRFTGFNASNPGFVFDGSLSKTTMYVLASQNLLTQTDGSTVINGNKLVFQGAAYISPYQQPLTITKSYPGLGVGATLVLDNDVLGTPPAAASYKILQAKYGGTEVSYLRGDGGANFNADVVVNGLTLGRGGSSVSDNTAFGVQSLTANTSGVRNTALGYNALWSNTTSSYNTAIGATALKFNTGGASNTAVGYASLRNNTAGSFNTAVGENSLLANTTGTFNTALGRNALTTATTAYYNTAVGYGSQNYTSTGQYNTSTGAQSLYTNSIGANNTGNGYRALYNNMDGNQNTAVGVTSLFSNTAGSYNTAIGMNALYGNTTGINNTAIGIDAIKNTTTANSNIAIGNYAGSTLTAGNNNIFIGYSVQPNISTTSSNQLNIGNWIYGNNGNIGIGVASPSARLHSNGTLRLEGLTTNNTLTNILAADASGNVSWRDAATLGGSGSSQWTTVVNDIYYSTGNVGIGVSNPSQKLDVSGDAKVTGRLLLETATNNNVFIGIGAGALSTGTRNIVIGTNAMSASNTNYDVVAVGYNANATGSEASAIGVYASAALYGTAIGRSAYADQRAVAIGRTAVSNIGGAISIGYSANVSHVGGIAIGNGMTTTGSYQLLIGNSLTGYGVRDVYIGGGVTQTLASTYGPLTIQPTGQSGTDQDGQTIRIATGKGTGTGVAGDIVFMSSTPGVSGTTLQSLVDRMVIKGSSGFVGIGTSNPQSKLAVNGDIYAKKVKVTQTGWADYVFDRDYKLPTLKEVEAFIQKNKHLPDVPSAVEVEKNGLDLGDNQATLLKKIEELTLYMIDLNKKVEKLEEENEALKKELKMQKKK